MVVNEDADQIVFDVDFFREVFPKEFWHIKHWKGLVHAGERLFGP